MSNEPFDPASLDPGIRDVVLFLRSRGFDTTDSGDGVSKTDMSCALDVPNVFIATKPTHLAWTCDSLRRLLETSGVTVVAIAPEAGVHIQGSYDPVTETAFVALYGLNSERLRSSIRAVADAKRAAELAAFPFPTDMPQC